MNPDVRATLSFARWGWALAAGSQMVSTVTFVANHRAGLAAITAVGTFACLVMLTHAWSTWKAHR